MNKNLSQDQYLEDLGGIVSLLIEGNPMAFKALVLMLEKGQELFNEVPQLTMKLDMKNGNQLREIELEMNLKISTENKG